MVVSSAKQVLLSFTQQTFTGHPSSVRHGDQAVNTTDHFIRNPIKQHFMSIYYVLGTRPVSKDATINKAQSPPPRRSKFIEEVAVSNL